MKLAILVITVTFTGLHQMEDPLQF